MCRLYVAALVGLLLTATSAAGQDDNGAQPATPAPSDIPPMPADVPAPDMPAPTPQSLPPGQGPRGAINFQTFYDELSPYGSWIQTPDYGWVWLPAGEPGDWQPYTTGKWIYTADYGYVWSPDESWGWAPFHYGNWISTPSYGWAWVPGYTWGPGWVDWYYGAGYIGWAPLPAGFYGWGMWGFGFGGYGFGYGPGYYGGGYYGGGVPSHPRVAPDTRNNVRNAIDPNHYVYVPANKFQGQRVSQVMTHASNMNSGTFANMVHVDRVPTNLHYSGPALNAARQISPGQTLGSARVIDGSHPSLPVAASSGAMSRPLLGNVPHTPGTLSGPAHYGLPPISGSSVVPTHPHMPGAIGPSSTIAGHQIQTRPWTQQAIPRFSATPRLSQPSAAGQFNRPWTHQAPMSRSAPMMRGMPSRTMAPHAMPHFGGGHFGGGHFGGFGGGHHR